MRTILVLAGFIIALAGCSSVDDPATDTGTEVPTDAADTSGEADVSPDLPDVADTPLEPEALDDPVEDPIEDPVEDPVEEIVPDVEDVIDVTDPPWDPPPDMEPRPDLPPDTTVDLPPDTTVDPPPDPTHDPRPDTTYDISTDPAGDCTAGTCTDYVGRAVCVGGTGLTTCTTDPSCVMYCVCDAPGTWGICLWPCIC